jgi:hypothetical protein
LAFYLISFIRNALWKKYLMLPVALGGIFRRSSVVFEIEIA